jgi:hypothetical protein
VNISVGTPTLTPLAAVQPGTAYEADGECWMVTDQYRNGRVLVVNARSGKAQWLYGVNTIVPLFVGFVPARKP